ncbi:MAG: hypothetical protein AAGC80_21725 [Rhodococcus sp. (in: high G+C Gram-positive bacteria)]
MSTASPEFQSRLVTGTALGKCAATLVGVCAIAHIPVLPSHLAMAPLLTLIMAGLVCGCVGCARHLWTRPTLRAWSIAAALAAAMLTAHLMLMMAMSSSADSIPAPAAGHHHGGGSQPVHSVMPGGYIHDLFQVTTLLAAAQVLLAAAVIGFARFRSRRHRWSSSIGSSPPATPHREPVSRTSDVLSGAE